MIKINEPGALVASLPGALGFVPEDSLVAVVLKDGNMMCVMRVDRVAAQESFGQIAKVVADSGGDSVIAVWVGDDNDMWCRMCVDERVRLSEEFGFALLGCGVTLLHSLATDNATWARVGGDERGTVPDSSALTAAAVAEGRVIHGRRDDMVALFDGHPTIWHDELENGDGELAQLGRSLLDGKVRDQFYAAAVSPDGGAATEARLLDAARQLPGEYRAHALVVVAFLAYCRGDGTFAGEALDRSLAAAPTPMAKMLDAALRSGVRPSEIRKLAPAGVE